MGLTGVCPCTIEPLLSWPGLPLEPISWSSVATLLLAPFGAFAINLAAITAAISMGQEAHENPDKRYVAAVMSGVFYIVTGLFGATVVSIFAALPQELVVAIAGLALLNTIGKGLAGTLSQTNERGPALITFLVTASGILGNFSRNFSDGFNPNKYPSFSNPQTVTFTRRLGRFMPLYSCANRANGSFVSACFSNLTM